MVKADFAQCDECGTCIGVCPANALSLVDRLVVDASRCTSCGQCVTVCPFGALSLDGKQGGARV